jgi:hypothetical protein
VKSLRASGARRERQKTAVVAKITITPHDTSPHRRIVIRSAIFEEC